ncbi:hypothetical protein DFH06DRAFT_1365642 [Mycena polygramma]|nr:hypothetical protein DFH06DRAFT_1365642 [Mycena polygramma]
MRPQFLSLLLVLCALLASQAAPIDSRALSTASRKAATKPVKAAPKPVKAAPKPAKATPKPVKAASKPVKAAPKTPAKAAPKPGTAAPKPVPQPVKSVPKPVKLAPKPATGPPKSLPKAVKAAPKAAPKPVKVAPKPIKAAPKPLPKPVKVAPKAPVKTAPNPVKAAPKPVKATIKPVTKPIIKATPNVPVKAVPKPVTAAPKPVKAKPVAPQKILACPIRKNGSAVGLKPRGASEPDCDGSESTDDNAAEICDALSDQCDSCVGLDAPRCAFDVNDNKCIPASQANTASGPTLATSKKTCGTLLAAKQAALAQAALPPAVDENVKKAAEAAFEKVKGHIFQGTPNDATSGRHTLSSWKEENKDSKENKRDKTTGVIEFQTTQRRTSTLKTISLVASDTCVRGYQLSISTNGANKVAPIPAGGRGKAKGKGKGSNGSAQDTAKPPPLKIKPGFRKGIIVFNKFINQKVCLNVNSESCFPLGTGTVSGNVKKGEGCTGDDAVQD